MACKKCYECVELVGLSGIGKKGTLAAAKALSTEKILENHNAFLDLMELILSKMNGDMQRFARICGSSLSPKARDLLEERVNTSKSNMPLKPSPSRSTTTARLQSRSSPTKNASPTVVSKKNRYDGPLNSSFGDSLPALGLRDYSPSGIPRPSPSKLPSRIYRSDSFTEGSAGDILSSLLDAEDMLEETGGVPKINVVSASLPSTLGVTGAKPFTAPPVVQPQVLTSPSNGNPENPNSSSSEVGAAASLRARLQKIREKSKGDFMDESSKANSGITSSSDSLLRGTQNRPSTTEVPYEPTTPRNYEGDNLMHDSDENDKFVEQAREELEKSLDAVAFLISKNTPLREDDSDIFATTDVLKTIHAAVSQQANLAVNLSPSEVKRLRVEIESRANEVVASLTR
jgi:cytoskeleton-associated protein 5